MAKTVNLYEAKTKLSRLVEQAADGEEIIIAKAGRPRARLVSMGRPGKPRRAGRLEGAGRHCRQLRCSPAEEAARRFSKRWRVRLLLDTHVFLWWLADDDRLKKAEREAIRDQENDVYLSAASIWEIVIKQALGRLRTPEPASAAAHRLGLQPLPDYIRARRSNGDASAAPRRSLRSDPRGAGQDRDIDARELRHGDSRLIRAGLSPGLTSPRPLRFQHRGSKRGTALV